MIEPTPITEPLDVFLRDVVRALSVAVTRGTQGVNDPAVVDKTLQDCEQILAVIMAGHVQEWLAG